MAKTKATNERTRRSTKRAAAGAGAVRYRGKQAKTGNSLGFRFDRALFKSHPEFNGEVTAQVIAPGRMLVSAETVDARQAQDDQVVAAFLAFLAKEMKRDPQAIQPLDRALMKSIGELVKNVKVSSDENLGDEALI
jgi:antitoxin PrlF